MRASDPTEIPNPFLIASGGNRRPARRALYSALKFFALVAVTFAATIVISVQSRQWLLNRLTSDFETLSAAQKQERLLQIAELGTPAVKTLVNSLADDDIEVARTAYDLLRTSQNGWAVLDRSDAHQRHLAMIRAMNSMAVHLPDDRTGWATGLLQQTILETVDQADEPSRDLYRHATDTLAQLSLSERSGPSILTKPSISNQPVRLTARNRTLPVVAAERVSSAETIEQWTDWPPPGDSPPAGRISNTSEQVLSGEPVEESISTGPSVYRSSSTRLQPVTPGDTVILRDMNAPRETSYQSADILPATHLVDSPLETYDTRSVVYWLASQHPALREKAELELVRRGLTSVQISVARRIASGDVSTRLALVDSIARSDHVDPRPWLLMMLDDQNRDVQLRVVSALATMSDRQIRDQLQMRLVDGCDPTVAARIRRVLDLR